MKSDIGNIGLVDGNDGICCIPIYAGVAAGTVCKPLGSTTFSCGVNVLRTGANTGPKFDDVNGGNMRNVGGAAMLDENGGDL